MKNFSKIACLLLCATLATKASAGERLICIVSAISTTKSSAGSNPDGGPNSWDGGIYQPCNIPAGDKITVQCIDNVYVCTDVAACTATNGVALSAGTIFPTSVGGPTATITGVGAQTIRTAEVSILPQVTDAGTQSCKIFERSGRE